MYASTFTKRSKCSIHQQSKGFPYLHLMYFVRTHPLARSARAATRGAPRGYHTSAAIRAKSASKFSKWYKKC